MSNVTAGVRDVIGLDVLRLNKKVQTIDEAKKVLIDNISEDFDIVTTEESTYVIRTSVADLNYVNGVIPEDLEQKEAFAVQVKISEMLQSAGLNVGIDESQLEELEEMAKTAKEELSKTKS